MQANERKCPHCAENIKRDAQICRYCGRSVKESSGMLLAIIGAVILLIALASSGGRQEAPAQETAEPSVPARAQSAFVPSPEDCERRGVEYFEEIGSYPKLSDGRDAQEVAIERCGRTPTAFGPWN